MTELTTVLQYDSMPFWTLTSMTEIRVEVGSKAAFLNILDLYSEACAESLVENT